MERRTKIVATIGPASREPEVLVRMVEAGMDVARLNFSHGNVEEHAETASRIRDAAGRAGRPVAILQDLPGPKLRIGPLAEDHVELGTGDTVTFVCGADGAGTKKRMSVAYAGLAGAVESGAVMYLADGSIRLRVLAVRAGEGEIDAEVEVGGPVASRQGLNVPGPTDVLPAVPQEDLELLSAGERMGADLVALSFVRRPEDVSEVRRHTRLPLIAKIEKPQAVDRAEDILHVADCVMVARGDLGIELPIEKVPLVQKRLLALAGRYSVPSITATQMLASMVASPRPTRAEVSDVASAIYQGTDAVMLSEETAVGQFPVEAVRVMDRVAREIEPDLPYGDWVFNRAGTDQADVASSVARAAVGSTYTLGLAALVVPTRSGRTARLVSAHRPRVPVLAVSPRLETVRRLNLLFGVQCAIADEWSGITALLDDCARLALESGVAKSGELIGVTAGLPQQQLGTNLFEVHRVP